MTLVKSVGGASGPLYGTFFLRMAPAIGSDGTAFAAALRAGVDGVVQRGRAEAGDKTMFDALAPALDALDAALASGTDLTGALAEATTAAERAGTPPNPWWLAKAAPAIWGNAASGTSTRAPRRQRC